MCRLAQSCENELVFENCTRGAENGTNLEQRGVKQLEERVVDGVAVQSGLL